MKQQQRIILQYTPAANAAQHQKSEQPIQKMGKRPKQTFLQRIHTDEQKKTTTYRWLTNTR